jgi:hypothetical protein
LRSAWAHKLGEPLGCAPEATANVKDSLPPAWWETAQGLFAVRAQPGCHDVAEADEALSCDTPSLEAYEEWRDARASQHYEWSFSWGRFPPPESENLFRGWAREADAAQDLRDSFSRRIEPSGVLNRERLARWFTSP